MKGNYTTVNNGGGWLHGSAYIVETRNHVNLPLVLNNAHECLPETWKIVIFCGPQNYLVFDTLMRFMVGRRVTLITLEKPIETLGDYNDLLLSPWFWQQFETENLLGFQVDSLFNPNAKKQLASIAQYDYIGAPWSDRIQRRWSYIPPHGGNGGVCFSKRSARLAVLDKASQARQTGEPHYQLLNEDIWFSHAFKEMGCRLPKREEAIGWFVESVYSQTPFAVHKPWCYVSPNEFSALCVQLPQLTQLRKGCEMKVQENNNDDYRRFLLRFARECLKEDNLYQADLALQVCQNRFPADPVAYNLQSTLAYHLGLYEQAKEFVEKSLSLKPDFSKALDNKKYIESALKSHQSAHQEPRYLLIHSWGSGLGFDLLYLLKQLMVAELTDRQPLVYWGANSLYNGHPESDCFTDYFDAISELTFQKIEPYHDDCFPSHWQKRPLNDFIRRTRWRNTKNNQQYTMTGLYYLNRDERLLVAGEFSSVKTLLPWIPKSHRFYGLSVNDIYRELMTKYIKPKKHLQKRVDSFIKSSFAGKPFIAIHLRGTDKQQEKQSSDIAAINQQLIEQLMQLDETLPVFVMTDDVRQISAIRACLGRRVHSVDVTRSDGDELGVHHTANDKQKIAEEVIVDMLIAAQSFYFLGCGFSYLACCVAGLRTQEQESHTILQPFDVMTRFTDVPMPGRFGIE